MVSAHETLVSKGLSNREIEVVMHVSKGQTNKEIASQLFITEKTVKFHLTSIYKKLNLKSRAQLIVMIAGFGPHLESVATTPAPIQEKAEPGFNNAKLPVGGTSLDQ